MISFPKNFSPSPQHLDNATLTINEDKKYVNVQLIEHIFEMPTPSNLKFVHSAHLKMLLAEEQF